LAGINIRNSDSCLIIENIIHDIDYNGIRVNPSDTSTAHNVYDNTIYGCGRGIELSSLSGRVLRLKVMENIIFNNGIGIKFSYDDNPIKHNLICYNEIFSNDDYGIDLRGNENFICNNLIYDNEHGVKIIDSKFNDINGNFIFENNFKGLSFHKNSRYNNIDSNRIYSNRRGIQLKSDGSITPSYNNFRSNQFIDNEENAFMIDDGFLGVFTKNDIIGTDDFEEFVNNSRNDMEVYGNFWNTINNDLIQEIIYDYHDDDELGEVLYDPVEEEKINALSYDHDLFVTKKKVGNDLLIQWNHVSDQIFAGYKVYFYRTNGFHFDSVFYTFSDTSFLIKNFGLEESVAVTVRNRYADNNHDILDGTESWYHFAVPYPYAGEDNIICANNEYTISDAQVLNPDSFFWQSSGDGVFLNVEDLKAVYIPGQNDINQGFADLIIKQELNGDYYSDTNRLSIKALAEIIIEAEAVVYQDSIVELRAAVSEEYESVRWSGSGSGSFNTPTSESTIYRIGEDEVQSGSIKFVVDVSTECGVISKEIELEVRKTFKIHGNIHVGELPLQQGVCLLVEKGESSFKASKLKYVNNEGYFIFDKVPSGDYLLYAIPNYSIYGDFFPTYYANKLHFENAYSLQVEKDVYDIDIALKKTPMGFPKGVGVISGKFTHNDTKSIEESIYGQNWENNSFEGIKGSATPNMTIFLYSSTMKPMVWTMSDQEGSFQFDRLPFGTYYLYAEKAGYPMDEMKEIILSPENSVVDDIQINLNAKNIKIIHEADANQDALVSVSPNPTSSFLTIRNNGGKAIVRISLLNTNGDLICNDICSNKQSTHLLFDKNVASLASGIYYLIIFFEDGSQQEEKVVLLD
jgi:parallel beta-helix repeat protein